MTTILITSGYGGEDQEYAVEPDLKATSIEEAAEHILQRERN